MTEERAFELLQDLNGMTREEAIEVLELHLIEFKHDFGWNRTTIKAMEMAVEALEEQERHWIPFNIRSLTEEEKEDHPEWDCILDCELPDDGQEILVSINVRGHERVQYDEFFNDDGSYLDSGYEIGTEATAWMPLPGPYKAGEQNGIR